jgi:hypothetical protein
MYTFKYFDNFQGGKLIFEIDTESILIADEAINKSLNIKVEKSPGIGCTIYLHPKP